MYGWIRSNQTLVTGDGRDQTLLNTGNDKSFLGSKGILFYQIHNITETCSDHLLQVVIPTDCDEHLYGQVQFEFDPYRGGGH